MVATKPTAKPRKPAPVINVDPHRDYRKETLDELDAENPGFVHMYADGEEMMENERKFAYNLKVKGQEVVKDAESELVQHQGDPVVRVPREVAEASRKLDADRSRIAVESVVDSEQSTVLRDTKKVKQVSLPKE